MILRNGSNKISKDIIAKSKNAHCYIYRFSNDIFLSTDGKSKVDNMMDSLLTSHSYLSEALSVRFGEPVEAVRII